MEFFDKKISNLIEQQFPATYRENGSTFVQFVKAYYEWMEETNNVNFFTRRLLDYRDIDSTVDGFIKHFKYKYLNSIQFDTAVDTKKIVKHSLDLYRSKGTERSIDLFFKSVFGVPAEVYFPARDIFRTSSGTWIEPKYLEIESFDSAIDFVGLQIEGIDSGAKAFVERYVKKFSTNGHVSHLLFISSITGIFNTGEKIRTTKSKNIGPTIIGSLNYLSVVDGGSGFSVGDIVEIQSNNNGRNAAARVSAIESISGKVAFTLLDGGWGYNSNSQIIIAEKMIIASKIYNLNSNNSFNRFETVVQPLANLHYSSLSGVQFTEGDLVFKANSTSIIGQASVISIDRISNTEGYLLLSTALDKFDPNYSATDESLNVLGTESGFEIVFEDNQLISNDGNIYKYDSFLDEDGNGLVYEDSANLLSTSALAQAVIVGSTDLTASANLMKYSSNVTIEVINSLNQFSAGEELFQYSANSVEIANAYINQISYVGSNATIKLINVNGSFFNGNVHSRTNSSNAEIISVIQTLGFFDVENDFIADKNALMYGLESSTYATISVLSQGSGGNFSISNTYVYEEIVARNTDVIQDYITVQLDAADYGFPSPGNTDLSSTLDDAFTYDVQTYGRISNIIITNSGVDYNFSPYVAVFSPELYAYKKRDFIVNIADVSGSFSIGEAVTQNGSVIGIVKNGSNNSVLFLKRTTFDDIVSNLILNTENQYSLVTEDKYYITEENYAYLYGLSSGSSAQPIEVSEDASSEIVGLNAEIVATTTSANGSVLSLEVSDSGFSYFDGELVSFMKDENDIVGTALAYVQFQGTSTGYHTENNSTLSQDKYIQDGRYYQEFSYEVRSAIVLDKYSDMLKQVMHVAGTELFSRFIHTAAIDLLTTVAYSSLTIS